MTSFAGIRSSIKIIWFIYSLVWIYLRFGHFHAMGLNQETKLKFITPRSYWILTDKPKLREWFWPIERASLLQWTRIVKWFGGLFDEHPEIFPPLKQVWSLSFLCSTLLHFFFSFSVRRFEIGFNPLPDLLNTGFTGWFLLILHWNVTSQRTADEF